MMFVSMSSRRFLIVLTLALCLSFAAQEAASAESKLSRFPSSVIFQADPSSLITNYAIPTSNSVPNAIIEGASNHTFWFTEFGAGKLGEISIPAGNITEYTVGTGAMPATLALDNRGLIWFTDENQNSPGVWSFNATSQTFHHFSTGPSLSDPIFVLVDPTTNNVWFTDYYGNYLGEINSSTLVLIEYPIPTANSYPVEIAKQNGSTYLWITEATGRIARFDMTDHSFQQFTPTVSLNYPVGIVVDKNNHVWVSEHGGSSVTEFIPSNSTWKKYPTSQATTSPGTGVATLAMDSQGRLWFAEHYANRIGRLDPATGQMDEFALPIAGAYSLLDTVDTGGNFWFTEATANEIGTIPGNATAPFSSTVIATPGPSVTAGSSIQADFVISNKNLTNSVTLSLNVTSSFTSNYYTTKSEVSLSTYALTLGPGQSQVVTAVVTPDFSLDSGLYAAGIVVTHDDISSIDTFFLQVNSNPLHKLETLLPEILISAAIVLLLVFLLLRRQKRISGSRKPSLDAKVTQFVGLLVLFLFLIQKTGLAWGKCPGLPPPPSGAGPDPYGIALDVGSIVFFAIVAYLLIRNRLRGQTWSQGKEQSQPSKP
jgi:streptogramin lyase